jgi:hypothetical protein
MEGLIDGTYRLSVSGSGGGFSASRTVTVSGDSTADVALRGVSASGVVTDADSGEPIVGASVRAQMTGLPSGTSGETDSRGHYLWRISRTGTTSSPRNATDTSRRRRTSPSARSRRAGHRSVSAVGPRPPGRDGQTTLAQPERPRPLSSRLHRGSVALDATGQGSPSLAPGRYSLSVSSAATRFERSKSARPPDVVVT